MTAGKPSLLTAETRNPLNISTKLLFHSLTNFFESCFGFTADFLELVQQRRFKFLVLQLGEIDLHIQSRPFNRSARREKTDAYIGNRSRISLLCHFRKDFV